jgi:hypothetical protein
MLERVKIYEMDYKEFFDQLQHDPDKLRVGLYYYDACHSTFDTFTGMSRGFPYLVKGGFIVADDIAWDGVSEGLNQFIAKFYDQVKIIFTVNPCDTPGTLDDDWWNGTIVLEKIK